MVGRKIENIYGRRRPEQKIGEVLFEVEGISRGESVPGYFFSGKERRDSRRIGSGWSGEDKKSEEESSERSLWKPEK